MVFGNTGMDDKDLFIRAANGEDVISSMYPNMTLQNLRMKVYGYTATAPE